MNPKIEFSACNYPTGALFYREYRNSLKICCPVILIDPGKRVYVGMQPRGKRKQLLRTAPLSILPHLYACGSETLFFTTENATTILTVTDSDT